MTRAFDNIAFALIGTVAAITIIFLFVPVIIASAMAFDARTALSPFPPSELSLQWFRRFVTDDYYQWGLSISIALALISAAISTAMGACAAFALHRRQLPFSGVIEALFLSPLVVPSVVLGFGLLLTLGPLLHINGFTRLVCGHVVITIPFTVRNTMAGLVGIPSNLTEAALALGANERQAFWRVTFPLARAGIIAGAAFAVAFSLDDVSISLFLSTPDYYTLPVAMINMMRGQFDLSIAAASVLFILVAGVLTIIVDHFVGVDKALGRGMYAS